MTKPITNTAMSHKDNVVWCSKCQNWRAKDTIEMIDGFPECRFCRVIQKGKGK